MADAKLAVALSEEIEHVGFGPVEVVALMCFDMITTISKCQILLNIDLEFRPIDNCNYHKRPAPSDPTWTTQKNT